MATPLSKVYDKFLTKVDDSYLIYPTIDETDEEFSQRLSSTMRDYLDIAIASWLFPIVSLEIDEVNNEFANNLSPSIQLILAMMMIKEHRNKKLSYLIHLGQSFKTKDFERHSKANEMDKLQSAIKDLDNEIDKLISRLDYSEVEELSDRANV